MKRLFSSLVIGCVTALLVVTPVRGADREHQQMMADIRMLQEQTVRLALMLGTLDETLKTLLTKLDAQAQDTRRAFADQKLLVDNLAGGVRIVREKVDETNVRVSSVAQEVEALRLAIPPRTSPMTQLAVDPETGLPTAQTPVPASVAVAPVNPGVSPQRLYDTAWAELHHRAMGAGYSGLRGLHQQLPPVRACRRRTVLHREHALCRRAVPRGGRGLRAGGTQLSRWRSGGRGALQTRSGTRPSR